MAQPSSQYLKRRGNRWFLKLPIPRAIRHLYPTSTGKPRAHIEEALRTGDLVTANRAKYGRIAYWVADFRAKERAAAGTFPSDLARAQEMREALRAATTPEHVRAVLDYSADRAYDIAADATHPDDETLSEAAIEKADQFISLATTKLTLREAWGEWEKINEHDASTKLKDEQAFRGLMDFLGVADATPLAVTGERARAYVRWLNTDAQSARGGPLAKATKDARLWPLRSFWEWLDHNEAVPRDFNPWKGHRLTGKRKPTEEQPDAKRPYTDDEIIRLLNGPELRKGKGVRYGKRALLEVYALCFYTGARIGEIANRRLGDVEKIKGGYMLHIRTSKTDAGPRSIPILHPIPLAILKRRIGKRTDARAQLFAEFIPGGPKGSLGWYVSKALGRYRDKVGLGPEVDTHSTRRRLITDLTAKGLTLTNVQFYVGHKPPGITAGVYAKPTTEGLREIAKAIKYPAKIERVFAETLTGT